MKALLLIYLIILPIIAFGTISDLVQQLWYESGSEWGSSTIINTYHYASDNPIMIDSITVTPQGSARQDEYNSIAISNVHFSHFSEEIDGLNYLSYYQYDNNNILTTSYKFITDTNDDLREIKILFRINTIYRDSLCYYYHYYQPGKPDSIMVFQTREYPSNSYSLLQYDNIGRLITSTTYCYLTSGWTPLYKWEYYYNISSLHYQAPLRFDLARMRCLLVGSEFLSCTLDKNVIPDSMNTYEWYENAWHTFYQLGYSIHPYDNGVNIYDYHLNLGYSYNNSGLFTCRYNYDGMEGYDLYGINWYTFNAVDNQVEPAIHNLISSYPNPFSEDVTIKILGNKLFAYELLIYNIKGQLIRTFHKIKATELTWDGKDQHNKLVRSGVYIIRARQGKQIMAMKVIKL